MNNTTRVLLAASIVLALGACTKKVKEAPVVDTTAPATTAPVSDGRYTPADLDTDACLRQRTVYFDFDQDTLRPEFQAIMACHAKYLNDRSESRVTLEGNADERGTREYNLGLGAVAMPSPAPCRVPVVRLARSPSCPTVKSARPATRPPSPAGSRTVASKSSTPRSKRWDVSASFAL